MENAALLSEVDVEPFYLPRPPAAPVREAQIPACEVRLLALALMNAERLATEGTARTGEECLIHGLSLVEATVPSDTPWKSLLCRRWQSAALRFRERHRLR